MTNVAVTCRFNESKHQMTFQEVADATPITDISGTRLGLMFKTIDNSLSKVALKSFFYDVLDFVRDNNILNKIKAGDYGPTGVLVVTATSVTAITAQAVTNGAWWLAVADQSVSVAIPLEAGWSRDDASTLYLDATGKRVFEKMREAYLVRT